MKEGHRQQEGRRPVWDSATRTLTIATGRCNVVIGSTDEGIRAMVALIDECSTLSDRQSKQIFKKVSPSSSVSSHDKKDNKI